MVAIPAGPGVPTNRYDDIEMIILIMTHKYIYNHHYNVAKRGDFNNDK